jgi:hypothetical protein
MRIQCRYLETLLRSPVLPPSRTLLYSIARVGELNAVLSAEALILAGPQIHNCEETEWAWSASLSFLAAKTSKWES